MTRTIAAVKYACDGEAKREFEIPVFKVYNLQPGHEIFERGEVSEVSRLIGMPLVMMPLRPSLLTVYRPRTGKPRNVNSSDRRGRLPPRHDLLLPEDDKDWTAYANYGSKDNANYFPNYTAARLMLVCSPSTSAPLLCPPAKWMDKVGSVLIARQDMAPLHPMHIEILKSFITAVYESLTEQSQDHAHGHGITAQAIAETITPGMWQAYWKMATEHMNTTGQSKELEGVFAPFDEEDLVAAQDDHEGGVDLGNDADMMECSDVGFTQ